MKKQVTHALAATAVAALLLSGCGTSLNRAVPTGATAGAIGASATKTLEDGFKQIHMAIFTKLDRSGDGQIDEYEAAPDFSLRDFEKADTSGNHKVSKREFMDYAIGDGLFGFMRQDKTKFMRQAREALAGAFKKMDKDRDNLLAKEEMKNDVLKKMGINLTIDGLHAKAVITEFDADLFEAADRTKDGKLGQAEFEDWAILNFLHLINPAYNPNPAPAPVPSEAPATPAAL